MPRLMIGGREISATLDRYTPLPVGGRTASTFAVGLPLASFGTSLGRASRILVEAHDANLVTDELRGKGLEPGSRRLRLLFRYGSSLLLSTGVVGISSG